MLLLCFKFPCASLSNGRAHFESLATDFRETQGYVGYSKFFKPLKQRNRVVINLIRYANK